jgi:hypothetical protein
LTKLIKNQDTMPKVTVIFQPSNKNQPFNLKTQKIQQALSIVQLNSWTFKRK